MDTSQPEARRGGLLERLEAGPVIGDGGFVFELEKRGYVKAGPWTPEVVVEHPEAVRQLHREFLRAGSDVMQALTFYASDDKLSDRGNTAQEKYTSAAINKQACVIAREIADEGGALMGAGVTQCPAYTSGGDKQQVQDIFRKQVKVFVENGCDFVLCEYFEHIEEMEWAIEVCKKTASLPIAATMCIGPEGDRAGVTTGECAVRMAKAGADLVGVNCNFGPETALGSMRLMKEALDQEGLAPYLICQPVGFLTPDANKRGAVDLPEFPFALEPRMCTRWQIQKYAREAHEMGIRYIGGCCGFESYHIRAVAEELATERGRVPAASEKHSPWGAALSMSMLPQMAARANREYWETMEPATGRPRSAAFAHIRPST